MSNFLHDNIKYIAFLRILFFCFVVGPVVDARSFSVKWSCKIAESSDWNQWSLYDWGSATWLIYQNFNTQRFFYTLLTGANISPGKIELQNNADRWSCSNYWYANYSNYHAYTNYNYIKVWKASSTIDSNREFYIWNDLIKAYRHVSTPWLWYSQDWVNFDMWFPYHWTIVFLDSTSWHTIQLIGPKTLKDKVLYVDPLEPDQNVRVLDFFNWKAWSYHDPASDLSTYMFWLWSYSDDLFFDDLADKMTTSYSITWNGWTYAFPPTASQWQYSYYSSADWTHYFTTETSRYWKTFSYLADLEFKNPTFWLWTNYNDYWSWQSVESNLQAWNNYQECERETSFKNFIVNAWWLCRSDFSNWIQDYSGFRAVNDFIQLWNIWNENLTWELESYFSWINLSYWCQALLNNSISLVKLYNIIWKDPEYYFNVMNELKYITNDNPYDITQICWERPAVPTEYQPVSNSSNVCSLDSWSNIINCFSFWSSESSTWSTYFTSTIDNVKSMVWSVFDSEFINPLIENYNSWFIYISNYSRSSCPVWYTSPFPSSMGDFIIYWFVALLGFVLFVIL